MTASRFFAAALLSAVALSSPLAASPASGRAEVRYADLDLSQAAGAATLRARVERAAARVCGKVDARDLAATREVAACRTAALANATPQLEVALAAAGRDRILAANEVRKAPSGL